MLGVNLIESEGNVPCGSTERPKESPHNRRANIGGEGKFRSEVVAIPSRLLVQYRSMFLGHT